MDDALAKRTANIRHAQLEILVSYMEKYPNLAVGKKENLLPEKRKAMWFDLYVQLNAVVGGTHKTLEQWKKTWNDQKAKTHAKAMKLIETGGKSIHLSLLEERILKILSLTKEFKSPDPSSDIFLIPETGIVFLLPIVAQNDSKPSVSQDASSTPSTSQDAPDTPLVSKESCEPALSESNNISVSEVVPNADTHVLTNPEPLPESPVITLSSTDIPFLIKQETQEQRNLIAETTNHVDEYPTERAKSITNYHAEATGSVTSPSANVTRPVSPEHSESKKPTEADCPSSTTTYSAFRATSGRGHKRQRSHLRSHYMTADKAAETFGYISERNCAVLERIASAMEAQASRAAKQTQLMREIVDIVKHK